MSFWGHLGALRKVVVRIVILVAVLACAFFAYMPWIFDHVIIAPCQGDFPFYRMLSMVQGDGQWLPDMSVGNEFHVKLINIELASQFFVHMSASWMCAMVVSFPFIIYQIWTFVSPGLYPNERRGARKAFLFGNVMFYLGMAVGYFMVFPLTLRFLADYHLSDNIENTLSLTSYMDSFYMLVLMMGVLFELPLLSLDARPHGPAEAIILQKIQEIRHCGDTRARRRDYSHKRHFHPHGGIPARVCPLGSERAAYKRQKIRIPG